MLCGFRIYADVSLLTSKLQELAAGVYWMVSRLFYVSRCDVYTGLELAIEMWTVRLWTELHSFDMEDI